MTAAQLKPMAALPPELRDRAGRIAECFHLDAPSWYGAEDHTPHLADVADAVWNRRRTRTRYLRWAEPHRNTRVVDPYGVVLKAGAWYLVAGHAEAEGVGERARIRTYRVSRILDAQSLAETFERPAGFALATHREDYLDRFDDRRHRASATVRVSPVGMRRLVEALEPVVVHAAHASATRPDVDGRVEVVLPIESVDSAITTLLPFGGELEVLGPPNRGPGCVRRRSRWRGCSGVPKPTSMGIGSVRAVCADPWPGVSGCQPDGGLPDIAFFAVAIPIPACSGAGSTCTIKPLPMDQEGRRTRSGRRSACSLGARGMTIPYATDALARWVVARAQPGAADDEAGS